MQTGKFIVFEGGDKSGKTTQIDLLKGFLESQGLAVLMTREPGGDHTTISEKIREIILDKEHLEMHPRTELLLYLASRAQHVEQVIKPALSLGKIVLCDRFDGSTFAYQGAARHLDLANIKLLNDWAKDNLKPDLVIYLDVTVEQAAQRRREEKQDRLDNETEEFHHQVREGYLQQAKENNNWAVVNGFGDIQSIAEEIKKVVSELLAK